MPLGSQTTRPAFAASSHAAGDAPPEPRGSGMVERDKPHPAPRPSPGLSAESDRAAFDSAWEREREDARSREERRKGFIQVRTDARTGGRVRVFTRAAAR
ncbi:MAG: hypothetical protein HQ481_16140 [Alphaproteobacteria bacterium]|nr:hypothetical protein [Alphaproteobacteria bacterium]